MATREGRVRTRGELRGVTVLVVRTRRTTGPRTRLRVPGMIDMSVRDECAHLRVREPGRAQTLRKHRVDFVDAQAFWQAPDRLETPAAPSTSRECR